MPRTKVIDGLPLCPICGNKAVRRNVSDKKMVCCMGHKWTDAAYDKMDWKVIKSET